uniref:Uncharacterized protein n=1 Tax=uncultured marine crenarchaeote HF4000_ANIW133C7 TaxID=455570 RepID=B3T3R7_9ARCH|nr:hypothetical protein ALOHA_HF4000ANIW133C7ctg1g33 [uncultured marine crenarchaeote HF4000_ANIW133C7]
MIEPDICSKILSNSSSWNICHISPKYVMYMTLYIVYFLIIGTLTRIILVLHNINIIDIIYSFYENNWSIGS